MILDLNPIAAVRFFSSENGGMFHYVAWTPPFENSWKLNFAGSIYDGFDIGGVGCVLRDENGIFKSALSAPVKGYTCAVATELAALKYGLYEAVLQGSDYLEIEGESEIAMRVILGQIKPSSPLIQNLFIECVSILDNFRMVRFHPVRGYVNRAANKLVELAIDKDETMRWPKEPPSTISEILIEDVIGRYELAN